ncbi:cyclin-dependent kinase 2-interacting protein [Parasteatoda tepidariorum]|uniref:cyclin-dependent kinase 2-interacting protein n=1 Tax=Parasteatoda tepidariorum TaxID=114398 RepID=UPI001C71ABB6|nr:cyclin-dependent kinase 2-interacting protein [Parasteatoda tepidariorum]
MSSKNLTGNKRIIRDSCIDLHTNVQLWRRITINMHSTILAISQIRQKQLSGEELHPEDKLKVNTFEELSLMSNQLEENLKNLESIVSKMEKNMQKLNALSTLSKSQLSESSFDSDEIPFQSWPLSKFCSMSEEIEGMYKEELKTKMNICRELCIVQDRSTLCFFETCWKYEPNIDNRKLNSLLTQVIFELELQTQL